MDKNIRILILDDSPHDAELEVRELHESGLVFASRIVATRKDFLNAIDEFRPALMLAEYDLPTLKGLEAMEISRERCPDMPFILVTGRVGEDFAVETLRQGVTDYVLKTRLQRLVPTVRRALKEVGIRTEHKRVEDNLRERDGLIRSIANNLTGAMVYQVCRLRDGTRKFTYVSDSVETFYGCNPQSAIEDPNVIYGKVHPDDSLRVFQEEEEANRHLLPFRNEVRMLSPDGGIRWSSFVSTPRALEDGTTIWDGIEFDITERKLAEHSLIEIKETLEQRVCERTAILAGVNRIFRAALSATTEGELGRACLAILEETTQSRGGFIGEVSPEGLLCDIAISGEGWDYCTMCGDAGQQKPATHPKIHGIYGRVVAEGKAFYTNDPLSHPDRIGTPEGHPRLTAFLGAPLLYGGEVVGLIALGNREGGYRQEDLDSIDALAPAFVEAIRRVRAEERLRERERDLEIKTKNLEEMNSALSVLLERRAADKAELEDKVLSNVRHVVEPYIGKLRLSELDKRQEALVDILEANLKELISSFTRRLSSMHLDLTPRETTISNLIRLGRTSKGICELLGLSDAVVAFHRHNIRKKLGLLNKNVNLTSYLRHKFPQ